MSGEDAGEGQEGPPAPPDLEQTPAATAPAAGDEAEPAEADEPADVGEPAEAARRRGRRRLLRIVQAALVVVTAYFIYRYLARSWAGVSSYHWTLHPGWLALSAVALFVFYASQALLWWLLLRGFEVSSPLLTACATWSKSILARYIPGSVFMFLGRAWMSHAQGLPVDRVTAAMVYEQALGIAGALLSVAVLFPFWQVHRGATAFGLLAVPVLIALMHPRVFAPLSAWALRLLRRPPLDVTLRFRTVLVLLLYATAFWLVAGAGAWALARSVVGLGLGSLPLVIVAFALSYVVGMVAFVFPSGFGVREAVLTASLARVLPASVALAWALLLRLWLIAIELIFVGASVGIEVLAGRRRPAPAAAAPPAAAAKPAPAKAGTSARPAAHSGAAGRSAAAAGFSPLALRPVVELGDDERARLFRRNALYVLAGAVAFTIVYALLSWLQYHAYQGGRFDLGNMVQAVYNTAHGHFLQVTTGYGQPRQMSRLGAHVDPILAFFALPWLVWPSPTMLLVAQAAIVATGAWPAYRLGARLLRGPRAGALLAGAYLLYPALGFLVLNEFHPVALATPLLLWAFLYLEEGRWWRAGVFLVLAALCKEDVPLVIGMMGVFFAIRKRSLWPLAISAVAAIYFVVAVWVVIPHFSGGQSAFVARYGEYADSTSGVVKGALLHPLRTFGDVFAPSDLRYWLQLLWPFGFTSLLSPLTALIALPELLLNALSSNVFQRDLRFHYTALEIPFLYAAAVLGVARLWRWLGGGFRRAEAAMAGQRASRETLASLVLVAALAGNYFLGPLPFSLPGARYTGAFYSRSAHHAVLDQAVKLIPPGVAVSVNNNVGAQLSARPVVYVFPYFDRAQYVIVDARHPFFYDFENGPMFEQALSALLRDHRFQDIYVRDGVYVFKRVAP